MHNLNQLLMQIATNHSADYLAHQTLLTLAWGPLINVALICILFKNKFLLYYLHFVLGLLVIVLTFIGPILFLMESGIQLYSSIWYKQAHNIIGFLLLIVVGFQGIFGYLVRIGQEQIFLKLKNLNLIKLIHVYFGYVLTLLAKFTYLIRYIGKWQLLPLIIFQVLSIALFIYLKLKPNSLTPKKFIQKYFKKQVSFQKIKSSGNYFIFSDLIYTTLPLQNYHPGGVSIIQEMKGRQIDRFIYGCYGPEMNPDIKCEHSINCFDFLNEPIGVIQIKRPYKNFKSINDCSIKSCQCLSNNQTFLIKLAFSQCSPKYQGYSNINQLGYYHSLTLNDKVTRLYTAVNCLRHQNIKLIEKIIYTQNQNYKVQIDLNQFQRQQSIIEKQQKQNYIATEKHEKDDEQNLIPLLIKKYELGKLTAKILDNKQKNNKIQLSSPKGQGLILQQIKNGKITILAGGTGLFPFMDLIDLLYKKDLINRNCFNSRQFIQRDPILANREVFNEYQIIILLSLKNIGDIHPLTLHQLNSLCSHRSTIKLTCHLKCSKQPLKRQFYCPNLMKIQRNLINEAVNLCSGHNFKKLYICGPPNMQKQTLQKLVFNKISKSKYHIV